MAASDLPSPDQLRQVLRYDPWTGSLVWRERGNQRWDTLRAGKVAGHISRFGYRVVCIHNRKHYGHRIAWCMVHGAWPQQTIDHIDGNKLNNRIENLRDVSCAVQMHNLPLTRANKSGVSGVQWHSIGKKWRATLRVDGKPLYLGLYSTIEEAAAVVRSKRASLGYYSPRHGT